MIEQAMVFALGFLIAGLIALAIAPAFWSRAIRLSRRRIEMQIPLSAREILAERDLLRAEFAVERRRLEQKFEGLNLARANDLGEFGRRATIIAEQQADLAALDRRNAEQEAELAALQRALAETTAAFATTETALYSASGLFQRRDAELLDARADLAAVRALSETQRARATALENEIAEQKKNLAAKSAEILRYEQELVSMRLEHDADLATLKVTAAKLADREEALKAAEKREMDLQRRSKQQVETTRAVERRHIEKIDRLRAAEAAAHQALADVRANCDSLTLELADLRQADGWRHAASVSPEREENMILRQKIHEIGAAIIRTANGSAAPALEDASTQDEDEALARHAGRALAKAGGAASSK
ncbi:hypothetical protein RZS28_04950 [Methylocapsa polymorpha]|uniref:Chromosome segregation ATPase n=1 Tax=Methylocapsa polymorpha TaxID=3080828 RepID=A0ABZ0HTU7_9HYPH|nr:hypothetical protein RZS28_04950 [Methylocapsa sp. RX1]